MAETAAPRDLLESAFRAALAAAHPASCLPPVIAQVRERGPALVLGAGKAAAAMAAALHAHWGAPVRGMVVTRYGHGLATGESAGAIDVIEAAHPSPDSASLEAGARLLALARTRQNGEMLCCLISGGGSSLAVAPAPEITFEQKRAAANFLIRQGADIREINCVRKHLSSLKGGRLAAAARPAPVVTFAISDVPGDNPADIASGPTIPDATTLADALAILTRHGYPAMHELMPALGNPARETPKPGDDQFARDRTFVAASAATALDASARMLERHGYTVLQLGDDLADEAQELGREHAKRARRELASGRPTALLSGGETRVVLGEGGGRGGRNTEYLAALALELDACPGVHALAADTDGIDGDGDHAGATIGPDTIARGAASGLSLASALARHDTYGYFDACGSLLRTGPTRTNVNDFRLILCHPETHKNRD